MAIKSANMTILERAVRRAATRIRRDFNEVRNLQVSRKGPSDFVSSADLAVEKILLGELSHARAGAAFVMEEGGSLPGDGNSEYRFIIDPIDGTSNFLHALPHFAISVALEWRGDLTAAVVFDPIKDEFFSAERGQGAYLNDRRLRVSQRSDLKDALVATGMPFHGKDGHEAYSKELSAVMAETAGIRRWGAASLDLAYVAAGRFDGFWERGLGAWDTAAGALLVRESGGFITQMDGRAYDMDQPSVLAANPDLHGKLLKLLKKSA